MNAPDAPFDEPWQAQLFALTVAMNEAGHFTWSEWADAFGPKVQHAPESDYWDLWIEAFSALLEKRDMAQAEEISALARLWQASARATPHGQSIVLKR